MQQGYINISTYFNLSKMQIVPQHKIAYLSWGDHNNDNIVICAHALTRNAYDFAKLADYLSSYFRVIAFDFVGRGDSDWLIKKKCYNYDVYLKDSINIIKFFTKKKVHWIGTSMGGIVGMMLAFHGFIKTLVLNDIGPSVSATGLNKITKHIGNNVAFGNKDKAQQYLKNIYSQFGIKNKDWQFFTEHSIKLNEFGKYQLNYDSGISYDLKKNIKEDIDLWHFWDKIQCPILLLHGEKSDILLPHTVEAMKKNKKISVHTVKNVGHAPFLSEKEELDCIKNWLFLK